MTGMDVRSPTAGEDTMHSKQTKCGTVVGVLLLALAGCGQTVELDQPGKVIPSSDPDVLGTVRERVVKLRADNERIYWLTSWGALRGCDKRGCASSVVTYAEPANPFASFVVQGGELFYHHNGQEIRAVMAVNVADPTLSRVVTRTIEPIALATDRDHLYLADELQVMVLPLQSDEEETPVTIPAHGLSATIGRALAGDGDNVYWFEVDGARVDLKRARNDGATEPETLVADVKFDPYYPQRVPGDLRSVQGLTFANGYIYWAENVLAGAIRRLPVAAVRTGEPETVAATIRFPLGLLLDGPNLFVEHEADAYEYAVSVCRLDSCAPRTLASDLANTDAFALDDQYLYIATTSQSLDPDIPVDSPVTVLRRSSREIGAGTP